MTARMVATARNYTREEKRAYRARVRRRHLRGHHHRLPLRFDLAGFERASRAAAEAMRKLSASIGVDPDVMDRLAEANTRLMEGARNAMRAQHPDAVPRTAEDILGMTDRRRGATLDEILDLPPSDLTWADFSGMFANEHQTDVHKLPEGWSQS